MNNYHIYMIYKTKNGWTASTFLYRPDQHHLAAMLREENEERSGLHAALYLRQFQVFVLCCLQVVYSAAEHLQTSVYM